MPVTIGTVAPFASFIVAYANNQNPDPFDFATQIGDVIKSNRIWCGGKDLNPPSVPGIANTFAYHLQEERVASWAGKNQIRDKLNHLIAAFVSGRFAIAYVSDADLKSEIHDALISGEINGWEPVDESVLIQAYIAGESLRTLWLGGTHRNVQIKPNSKILSGDNLADAIDPLGDSTFVAGTVRSSKAGVSLKRSGVWFGPKKNWPTFCTCAQTLLQQLALAKSNATLGGQFVHHGLARMVNSFALVGPAYHAEWANPETLNGVHRTRKLGALRDEFAMALGTGSPSSKDASLIVTHIGTGAQASLIVSPSIKLGRVTFDVQGNPGSHFQPWIDAVKNDAELLRIFYDCGHTIANATLTHTAVQDREFELEFVDFAPNGIAYNVDQEKPPANSPGGAPPLADMFTVSDLSLFKWVLKEGLSQLRIPQPQPNVCWIYCDDRPGEVADFIHVYKPAGGTPKITLIHVKGANSKSSRRQVSSGAYEIVAAQAMKNLRRIIASEILAAINNCVTQHGLQRVWDQPWAPGLQSGGNAPSDLMLALNAITANCDYEVIIVQPHVLKSKYIINGAQITSVGAKQLRSLLFGAQAIARVTSARFRVVSDNR